MDKFPKLFNDNSKSAHFSYAMPQPINLIDDFLQFINANHSECQSFQTSAPCYGLVQHDDDGKHKCKKKLAILRIIHICTFISNLYKHANYN